MRLGRAIDRFLEQKQLEDDFTPRSVESYYRVLAKLDDAHPDAALAGFDGRPGKELVRALIAKHWARRSAGRRANVISIFHSFFAWAEQEGFIDDDRVREIKRPPRRRPDVYRPAPAELERGYQATRPHERAAWILAAEVGLRASTIVALRWRDLDLTRGRIHAQIKGGHHDVLPLSPIALARLQAVYRDLEPDPDDYVFTVERVRFYGNRQHRAVRDPKRPATIKALWLMTRRACRRAGIRELGPHALRHGFATRFLRDSDRDVASLQQLLRHSQLETTMSYVDELRLDELEAALERAAERREGTATSVASTGDEADEELTVARREADGPGRSRTSGPGRPASDAGGKRADDDAEPPLTDPEGGHK